MAYAPVVIKSIDAHVDLVHWIVEKIGDPVSFYLSRVISLGGEEEGRLARQAFSRERNEKKEKEE